MLLSSFVILRLSGCRRLIVGCTCICALDKTALVAKNQLSNQVLFSNVFKGCSQVVATASQIFGFWMYLEGIDGTFMAHLWPIYGTFMAHLWHIFPFSFWCFRCTRRASTWCIPCSSSSGWLASPNCCTSWPGEVSFASVAGQKCKLFPPHQSISVHISPENSTEFHINSHKLASELIRMFHSINPWFSSSINPSILPFHLRLRWCGAPRQLGTKHGGGTRDGGAEWQLGSTVIQVI